MVLYCMEADQKGFPDNNILTHKKSGILRGEIVFDYQADEQQEMKTSGDSKKKKTDHLLEWSAALMKLWSVEAGNIY